MLLPGWRWNVSCVCAKDQTTRRLHKQPPYQQVCLLPCLLGPQEGCKVLQWWVCLSVCLFTSMYWKPQSQSSLVFLDRVAEAIIRLVASVCVCVCVCVSVGLSMGTLLFEPFDLTPPMGDITKCRSPKNSRIWVSLLPESNGINWSGWKLACKRRRWFYNLMPNWPGYGVCACFRLASVEWCLRFLVCEELLLCDLCSGTNWIFWSNRFTRRLKNFEMPRYR